MKRDATLVGIGEQKIGHLQRHHSKRGTVIRYHRPRAHTLSDELVPPRRPIEPVRFGWRDTFNLIASFLVIGGIYVAFLAWLAIAAASQVKP